jgi:regulator of sirC expression with transglutaminase-like and TPR domain
MGAFADHMQQDEHRINIAHAALLFAHELEPAVDVGLYLDKIHALALQARERTKGAAPELACLALSSFLFDEMRYRGNTKNYYDPRNSYLHQVIDRRLGIPITLSTLYVEVGRQAGLDLCGVGFPGHFLVRHVGSGMLIDCFSGGKVLTHQECVLLLKNLYGKEANFDERFLVPAKPRETVVRMLNNLKLTYANENSYEDSLRVIRLIDVAWPNLPENVRDRGLVEMALEQFPKALQDLQEYTRLVPEGPDLDEVQKRISQLKRTMTTSN